MIRLFANATYDFIKWRRWAYGLTAAIMIPGFALFLVRGLNYSIEFTGGTLIQVQTTQPIGTGPVKGFAVTLIVGIVASMITAIFVVRTFYMIWLQRRPDMVTLSV